jgi:hypothetical protein
MGVLEKGSQLNMKRGAKNPFKKIHRSNRARQFSIFLVIWHVRYIKLIHGFSHEWNGPYIMIIIYVMI